MDKRFERFAKSHLEELGIDWQTADLAAEYDSSISCEENKAAFLEKYPVEDDLGPRQAEAEAQVFQIQADEAERRHYSVDRFYKPCTPYVYSYINDDEAPVKVPTQQREETGWLAALRAFINSIRYYY